MTKRGMISNMSEKKQVVSRLIKDNMEMMTACFDEYYFIISESIVKPIPENAGTFKIGELLPIRGDTYEFPETFNIIDLHYKMVGKIREGRLYDIERIDEYVYDGISSVNMMGYGIKLNTAKDFDDFKEHFTSFSLMERDKLAVFANKWFDILKYRGIKYL
jgi:bifunctional enzyme CysN/CysC/sulfate adenylyltransferase subunit 1